jgi:UDPglucose 6-dehydrogenase
MKITFINEMADLCEAVGADVQSLSRGIGLDKRIGAKFLHAGPGYGGSCFPKDTVALIRTAAEAGSPVRLVETTVAVNDDRKHAMAAKIVRAFGGDVRGKVIAVLGLTFKPNTDDMREAPSLSIIPALQALGATVRAFDPEGRDAGRYLKDVDFKTSAYDAVAGADGLVLLTEWDQFRALDLDRVRSLMRGRVVVDLRNVYKPDEMDGFDYVAVGRGRLCRNGPQKSANIHSRVRRRTAKTSAPS